MQITHEGSGCGVGWSECGLVVTLFLVSFALVVRPRYWIGAYEGKGARGGYAYLHTAIDGFSHLAYTEALGG